MGESTHLEALTAELLGDVGRLHDEVKALNAILPALCEDIRQSAQEGTSGIKQAFIQSTEDIVNNNGKTSSVIREIKAVLILLIVVAVTGAGSSLLGSWYFSQHVSGRKVCQLLKDKTFYQELLQLEPTTRDTLIFLFKKDC